MTTGDQRRAWVLTKLLCGELSVHEVAMFLDLSERSVWRLRARFAREGPAAVVHGNRGHVSSRRIDETTRARVLVLARTRYAGVNDTHLAELLAEREGIDLSRVTVRRILRAAGVPSPRVRRAPRHRSRRDRMAPGRPARPGRRLPTCLARGPRAAPDAGGRDRRRHRDPDRGNLP
jgi:transposase